MDSIPSVFQEQEPIPARERHEQYACLASGRAVSFRPTAPLQPRIQMKNPGSDRINRMNRILWVFPQENPKPFPFSPPLGERAGVRGNHCLNSSSRTRSGIQNLCPNRYGMTYTSFAISMKDSNNFDRYLEEQLQDPEFAERFNKAGKAWDVALQLADLRKKSGLSQKESGEIDRKSS